jgi:hypothetical protein
MCWGTQFAEVKYQHGGSGEIFIDRIPVGARFSAPVYTGPGANPASCTRANGSFTREGG